MSSQLKLFLTNEVIKLNNKANETGDPLYKELANELNEILNGKLEMQS